MVGCEVEESVTKNILDTLSNKLKVKEHYKHKLQKTYINVGLLRNNSFLSFQIAVA